MGTTGTIHLAGVVARVLVIYRPLQILAFLRTGFLADGLSSQSFWSSVLSLGVLAALCVNDNSPGKLLRSYRHRVLPGGREKLGGDPNQTYLPYW